MKTSHELARELLALPDLPVMHLDPSFAEACDEESNYTLGQVTAAVEDPKEGLTMDEVSDAISRGGNMDRFISLSGDQPTEYDRKP